MYYIGFSYRECMSMPIYKRRWFIKRVQEEIKKSQGQNKSAQANAPDTRAMMGRARSQVPAKLRRFS